MRKSERSVQNGTAGNRRAARPPSSLRSLPPSTSARVRLKPFLQVVGSLLRGGILECQAFMSPAAFLAPALTKAPLEGGLSGSPSKRIRSV